MNDTRFAHVAINCRDMQATEQFYTRHFGFERARVLPIGEGKQIIFLRNGAASLELFPADGERPLPRAERDGPDYPGVRHLAFQVENVDAKLAEMGEAACITLGPLDFDAFIPGWRTVWVVDPDGSIVEISQGYVDQDNPPAE